MVDEFKALCDELTAAIKDSYEQGITVEAAERLAGKFLYGQIQVSDELRNCALGARMRKSGVKAIRAAVYLAEVQANDKKPSDVLLGAKVDSDKLVKDEQNAYDASEVQADYLENLLDVFRNGHVHFRTIAKGSFGG